MALNIGTLVATVKVDDSDFDSKMKSAPTKMGVSMGAVAGVVAPVVSQVIGWFGDVGSAAVEQSDSTNKFKNSLDFSGINTDVIKTATKDTQAYADATVYSLSDIRSASAQFASLGVKNFVDLAKASGNVTAAAGEGADAYKSVNMVLSQTGSLGKLNTENWNQLAEAIPGASGQIKDALQKAGAYTGNFNDALAKGKISSDELYAAFQQVGNSDAAKKAATDTATFSGSLGNAQAAVVGLLANVLDKLKPAITEAFTIFSGFVSWIGQNLDWLTPMAIGIGIAAAAWGVFSAVLAAHAAYTAAAAAAEGGLTVVQWALNAAMSANPIGLIVVAIGLLIGAIILLVTHWGQVVDFLTTVWQGFVDWFTGIVDTVIKWWNDTWQGFVTWTKGLIDGFVGWWNGVWKAIGDFFKNTWDGFVRWVVSLFENSFIGWLVGRLAFLISHWDLVWDTIKAGFQSVWNGIVGWANSVIGGLVSWFKSAWGALTGFFSGLWGGISDGIHSVWTGVIDFFKGIPKTVMGFFSGIGSWLYNSGRDLINGLLQGIQSLAGTIGSFFLNLLPGWIVGPFKAALGINSPSKVFRQLGKYTMQGYIAGVSDLKSDVNSTLAGAVAVPNSGGYRSSGYGYGSTTENSNNTSKTIIYNAAPNATFSAEEELFAALGSPRVKD